MQRTSIRYLAGTLPDATRTPTTAAAIERRCLLGRGRSPDSGGHFTGTRDCCGDRRSPLTPGLDVRRLQKPATGNAHGCTAFGRLPGPLSRDCRALLRLRPSQRARPPDQDGVGGRGERDALHARALSHRDTRLRLWRADRLADRLPLDRHRSGGDVSRCRARPRLAAGIPVRHRLAARRFPETHADRRCNRASWPRHRDQGPQGGGGDRGASRRRGHRPRQRGGDPDAGRFRRGAAG